MKTHIVLFLMAALLSYSCNGQKNNYKEKGNNNQQDGAVNVPKGTWKVDKEFDEHGNLIRYDSIYSWSSNDELADFSSFDRDSILQSFKSKFFSNFSAFENQGFEDIFTQDSLFSKRYFTDDFFGSDFGKEFMNLDKIRQQMIERQKQFLEKYQSELITPEE